MNRIKTELGKMLQMGMLDDFSIDEESETVSVRLNLQWATNFLCNLNTLLVPECVFHTLQKQNNKDALIESAFICDKGIRTMSNRLSEDSKGSDGDNTFMVLYEELEKMVKIADLYKWDRPVRINNTIIAISPDLPDCIQEYIVDNADYYIGKVDTTIPDFLIESDSSIIINALKKSQSITELALNIKGTEEEARQLLLKYLNEGMVRFAYGNA